MNRGSRRQFVKVLLGGAASLAIPARLLRAAAREGLVPVRHTTFVMGQTATITAYGMPEQDLREAITGAFDALRRVDALMSVFNDASDVGRANNGAGFAPVTVNPWTQRALAQALFYGRMTHGAFDPTVEPLMRVWGFRTPRATMPADAELAAAYDAVGVHNVVLEPRGEMGNVFFRTEATKIDLGGIAVGFAIDEAAAVLKARGVPCALIDVSGDLFAIGAPPDSAGWTVGIVDPFAPERTITQCVINDQALSTSGNYESVVVYRAMKYGHIMDPLDGQPAHAISSATVIAPTSIAADALSTATFVNPDLVVPHGSVILVTNAGDVIRRG